MGIPFGAMTRKAERVQGVIAQIQAGGNPTPSDIEAQYGCSISTARNTLATALAVLNGQAVIANPNSDKKMPARQRVVCKEMNYRGGFVELVVAYQTMWGEDWGEVRKVFRVAGEFKRGRLPWAFGNRIAQEMVQACREKWGEFVCDLTEKRVRNDLHAEGIIWEVNDNPELLEPVTEEDLAGVVFSR